MTFYKSFSREDLVQIRIGLKVRAMFGRTLYTLYVRAMFERTLYTLYVLCTMGSGNGSMLSAHYVLQYWDDMRIVQ